MRFNLGKIYFIVDNVDNLCITLVY